MNLSEVNRFNKLYDHHQKTLKLQGKAGKTIDAYSRAVRRARDYFDCCPDKLKPDQLENYFSDLVESHSWSTVKSDIDADRKLVHIRRGKGHKDRLVPLPDQTLVGLRELWQRHQNPRLIFPNGNGSFETIRQAKTHMDRGGTQKAMKTVVTECGIKKKSPYIPCAIVLPLTSLNKA